MSEHIHIQANQNWPEWFLIHSITEATTRQGIEIPLIPEGGMRITLTINGVDCPIIKTLEHVEKYLDKYIQEKAEELIKEKMNVLDSLFCDVRESIEGSLEDYGFKLKINEEN